MTDNEEAAPPEGREESEGDGDADPFADIEGVEAEDDPFADLGVDDGDPSADLGPSDNTLFTDDGTSDLDDAAVWAQLEGEADGTETAPALDEAPLQGPPDEVAGAGETVVKKRSYCERCEHFAKPPEVACTNPGSEIVELVDTGRFRVRDCPVVERRQSRDISSIADGGGGTIEPEPEAGEETDSGADD